MYIPVHAQPVLHHWTFYSPERRVRGAVGGCGSSACRRRANRSAVAANPQFNRDILPASLASHGVAYEHCPALGGLREKQPGISPDINSFWKNRGFHNYADYALSEEFRSGLVTLRALGHAALASVMCAESLWWRCHRRIIADYLIVAGEEVFHILGEGHIEPARLTPEARVERDGRLTYPTDSQLRFHLGP